MYVATPQFVIVTPEERAKDLAPDRVVQVYWCDDAELLAAA